MKQCLAVVLLLLCLFTPLTAQGSKEDGQAAKELVVYASVDEANAVKILDAFTKDSGIKTSFVQLSSGPALTRIQAESGRPSRCLARPPATTMWCKNAGLTIPHKI